MRQAGLVGAYHRPRRRKTTVQDPQATPAPALVARAVPGARPQSAVGGGPGLRTHPGGGTVPERGAGRVEPGRGGLGDAPGCPSGAGGGGVGLSAVAPSAWARAGAPLRPGVPVHEAAVWSPAAGGGGSGRLRRKGDAYEVALCEAFSPPWTGRFSAAVASGRGRRRARCCPHRRHNVEHFLQSPLLDN